MFPFMIIYHLDICTYGKHNIYKHFFWMEHNKQTILFTMYKLATIMKSPDYLVTFKVDPVY